MKICKKHNIEYWQKKCPECKRDLNKRKNKEKGIVRKKQQNNAYYDSITDKTLCKLHKIEYINSRCKKCSIDYDKQRRTKAKKIEKYCETHDIKYFGLKCNKCNVISVTISYEKNKGKTKTCKKHNVIYTSARCKECIKVSNSKIRICKYHNIEFSGRACKNCEKERRAKNKKKRNIKTKERLQTDIIFKTRLYLSGYIRNALKSCGSSKNGYSIIDFLPYTIENLKLHIEKQFLNPGNEWMNWKNWTKYDPKTWNDNNSSTWAWNLDHIIPQSDLPYDSMEHPNFQKCWMLENLRPLSAKQNIIDGPAKTRHKKEEKS